MDFQLRTLVLVATLFISLSSARSASAQYGLSGFGGGPSLDEEIQEQRKKLMADQQQYTKPRAKPAAPGVRGPQPYSRGAADAMGRVDLSGRAAPRYPSIRDGSLRYSSSSYTRGHRVPRQRPQAPRLFPGVGQGQARRPR